MALSAPGGGQQRVGRGIHRFSGGFVPDGPGGFTKSAQFPFQSWLLGAMVALLRSPLCSIPVPWKGRGIPGPAAGTGLQRGDAQQRDRLLWRVYLFCGLASGGGG
jgi:hypothetical protein